MKTSISILAGAVLVLSACHHQPAARPPDPAQAIIVTQARLVLPAVKGNPGAAYFTARNDSAAATTLLQVDIVGARTTQMHETSGETMTPLAQVRIDPGQRVVFAPAGKHVMAFGLTPALTAGTTGKIVLHFQDGKITLAPLRIEAAGSGADDMAGMNMSGKP